jgi:hypothetical protein
MLNTQEKQNQKNLTIALAKFNRMYERVTVQERTTGELEAVTNYGVNMLSLFPNFFKNEDEAPGRVRTLQRALQTRKNEEIK